MTLVPNRMNGFQIDHAFSYVNMRNKNAVAGYRSGSGAIKEGKTPQLDHQRSDLFTTAKQ